MSINTPSINIYKGIRGKKFEFFLSRILQLSDLRPIYRDILLSPSSLRIYDKVFTHKTADPSNNYEFLEFLGDTTLNKSIAWYLSRRFPQLNCPAGVKILTRLKINLICKKSFGRFAKRLGFWAFVSADEDTRNTKMDKTLEDVFEAFFGATETIVDERLGFGVGYHVCYGVIKNILDTEPISLKYNDLFDAKTRLKEIFDQYGSELGVLVYESQRDDSMFKVIAKRKIIRVDKPTPVHVDPKRVGVQVAFSMFIDLQKRYNTLIKSKNIVSQVEEASFDIGAGSAYLKADAEQRAAEEAIAHLASQGYIRTLSDDYTKFCI